MRLRLYLRLWHWARRRAINRLREDFSTELRADLMDFDRAYQLVERTRVLNADNLLSFDYALHDAWQDFFHPQRHMLRERKDALRQERDPL